MGESAHFKCNIKQSARLSQHVCAMKPVNVLIICFNLSELYEILFYERFEWCMCVRGIGSKQHTGVSKANSASSPIWLKTKPRMDSEILRIDPESLERESRCIDFSSHPLNILNICPVCCVLKSCRVSLSLSNAFSGTEIWYQII